MSQAERSFGAALRNLQLRLHTRQRLLMIRTSWNSSRASHVAMNSGKRFGQNEGIPCIQDPGSLYCYVEREDGCAGHPCQMNRSGFRYISRTARTIDGKRDEGTIFEFAL